MVALIGLIARTMVRIRMLKRDAYELAAPYMFDCENNGEIRMLKRDVYEPVAPYMFDCENNGE